MKNARLFATAALGLSAPVLAQFTITPGGLNAGNGVFSMGAPPTSLTGDGFTTCDFRATNASAVDQLFQDWWWFRVAGDSREYAFGNGSVPGGPTSSGVLVGNNLGTLEDGEYQFTVNNPTLGYAFSSQMLWNINPTPDGPLVVYGNRIRNMGTAPLVISLFHYADFDVAGTAGGDSYSFSFDRFEVTDGATTLGFSGDDFAGFEADTFSALRDRLSDGSITSLSNVLAGSPGDFTGAFQWDLVLQPGQAARVSGIISFIIPAPGAAAVIALAGLLSARRRRA